MTPIYYHTNVILQAAIQSAKDHANAQVSPVHLANVLLNEGAGAADSAGASLFASVISKAGGDIVSIIFYLLDLT